MDDIAQLDPRARVGRRRCDRGFGAAFDGEQPAVLGIAPPGGDRQPTHRADRRQRLAAEAELADMDEIVARQLRRGVALDREGELVAIHAMAVIGDGNQRAAAVAQGDVDAARAGIERILDQLLHDRGRPLDDLAGGDLVDQVGR